jgi:hypothetical protein
VRELNIVGVGPLLVRGRGSLGVPGRKGLVSEDLEGAEREASWRLNGLRLEGDLLTCLLGLEGHLARGPSNGDGDQRLNSTSSNSSSFLAFSGSFGIWASLVLMLGKILFEFDLGSVGEKRLL